jgi:cellulose synthase/poly-beta-1,6-N-acetylglucosamine synthase-like glycosyltransferase
MFEIIFLIIIAVYFIQTVVFRIGATIKYPKVTDENLPSVSIIVAARNEENNIIDCMKALDNLEYPAGKLEIVLVDDHSTDSTYEVIQDFIRDKPKFRCISPSREIGNLKGKANAIANAIETVENEVVLTTDADCIVSQTWAKTLASYYQDDVAMVCGYTNQYNENLFEAMQSVDFIYLLAVAAGTMNLGKPLSCIGNNMSYRKSVYDEVGGYERIPFTVTEDFQLLMAMHNLKRYKIIYPLDPEGIVTSKPCENYKQLYWQKKRWGVGGLESDIAGYSVMAIGFVTHVLMLLLPFFYSGTALALVVFKLALDYFFLKGVHSKLKLEFSFSHYLSFQLYFIIYVLLLPFMLFFSKKVKWKGREF